MKRINNRLGVDGTRRRDKRRRRTRCPDGVRRVPIKKIMTIQLQAKRCAQEWVKWRSV